METEIALVLNWPWHRKRRVPNWTCPCLEIDKVVTWYRTRTFWNRNGMYWTWQVSNMTYPLYNGCVPECRLAECRPVKTA